MRALVFKVTSSTPAPSFVLKRAPESCFLLHLSQSDGEGGCAWARVQGAGMVDRAPSCTHTHTHTHTQIGHSLSSKSSTHAPTLGVLLGQGKLGVPESLQGEMGKSSSKSAQATDWPAFSFVRSLSIALMCICAQLVPQLSRGMASVN